MPLDKVLGKTILAAPSVALLASIDAKIRALFGNTLKKNYVLPLASGLISFCHGKIRRACSGSFKLKNFRNFSKTTKSQEDIPAIIGFWNKFMAS